MELVVSLKVLRGRGRRGMLMLGIPDFWIWSAYLLCILSAAACVIYGLINWNKGSDNEIKQIQEESNWEKVEKEVEANL